MRVSSDIDRVLCAVGTCKPKKPMKTTSLKFLVLASALGLGALTARADSGLPADQPSAPVAGQGLLGQVYGALTYSYIDLDGVSAHADNYHFALNQPLSFGLDGFLSYDYARFGSIAGSNLRQNVLSAGLRAFSTSYNWGKPYVEAGAGYAWTRFAGAKDNSFYWEVAVGAEIQVAAQTTVTPYVQYVDVPDIDNGHAWNFGVKGNYWVTPQWAVTAGLERDDDQNTTFTVGTNFRF